MKNKIAKNPSLNKWEIKFEDDHSISTWKYKIENGVSRAYEVVVEDKVESEQKKKSSRKKTN